ncbi:MAG TPA: hypothetical protein VMB81_03320, partial [Candidatus Sulfotelmatobacter sp.]|nr:hypothetical protein [Candidatus Sulfotelmatobacter sp.]
MLGLGFPGGPALEAAAADGDAARFELPRPLRGRPGADFSFSGLKTAVRVVAEGLPHGPEGRGFAPRDVADLAAGFQAAVSDVLVDRTRNAIAMFRARHADATALVVAGGVAANRTLRARLADLAAVHGMTMTAPPPALCTDNAAMIAWAGIERLRLGLTDGLDFAPRPRWPLDPRAEAA